MFDRRLTEENVQDVGPVSRARILEATAAAEEAFWDTFAAKFPEVTSGDVGPDWVLEREADNLVAVTSWLQLNLPVDVEDATR